MVPVAQVRPKISTKSIVINNIDPQQQISKLNSVLSFEQAALNLLSA